MLKEFMENIPINVKLTIQEFQNTLTREMIELINEKCGINLTQIHKEFTSEEIGKIIDATCDIYEKVSASLILAPEYKTFATNIIMNLLFDLWKRSYVPELFFIKIRQKFTAGQIVAALANYIANDFDKSQWVINFFVTHRQIFPNKNKKIHTIGVHYQQFFGGGIERFLSVVIPVYIKYGYRVILFTENAETEMDYPTPPLSESFQRITFNTPTGDSLQRLNELEMYIKKYGIDLMICHHPFLEFTPFTQILFCKLSGLKVIFQFHVDISFSMHRLPLASVFKMADAIISLSRIRMKFWENLGVRSYYIPHPITLPNKTNFNGRNPRKISNTILWVGRISTQKGPFHLIPIMKEVVAKIPDAKLKVLGGAFEEKTFEKFKALINSNNLESNIEICGYHKDVGRFYESADVMLNTSPHEGWSLAIAESKFYELPLVLYELQDNELTRDGRGCITVPQGDYQAAAQAVIKILTDEKLRTQISIQARESLQPFLDYNMGDAWQRVFEDLDKEENFQAPSPETEQIQNMLLRENFGFRQQIHYLVLKIQGQN